MKRKLKLNINDYKLSETGVIFKTEDSALQAVFDDCERLCKENRKRFGDYDVLIEGAKYNGVWLETQPMGGEMYAKRDMKAALSNILIFLLYQRRDGKFPGMISNRDKWQSVAAHYDWIQGCFLPSAALKMYYLLGKDEEYLEMIYDSLADFDDYLWSCRDSTGDGCLENWCVWDVGEDNSTVYMLNGIKVPDHGAWGASVPPTEYMNLPYKSPQYMGYSYAIRYTLSKISAILKNGKEDFWQKRASEVQKTAKEKLWDKEHHAFYPKDNKGNFIYALTQENIKCMYCGLMTQDMADAFAKEHLFNEEEFWTPYPFPAIAANDPYFHVNAECSNCADKLSRMGTAAHDIDDNSWSGPLNGLIWQRSIEALLNYGYHAKMTEAGCRILSLLKEKRKYVQNYHPFTGEASRGADGYGPTMLAALEYISLLYGINIRYDKILFSIADDALPFEYTQKMNGKVYKLILKDAIAEAYIDENRIFSASKGLRIETDINGEILTLINISAHAISPTVNGEQMDTLHENESISFG